MAGYIGTQAVSVNTTSATISDDLAVGDDLTVTDDATIGGTALVTGVLTTTAATVFNGGFTANAASTISTDGNEDTLVLKSNDADANSGPKLQLNRNSANPADGDDLGEIRFSGRNDAGQAVEYATFRVFAADVSDGTEDTEAELTTILAGTEVARMTMVAAETVFNQAGADLDFRVEGNEAFAFFVDGADSGVQMGGASKQTVGTNAPGRLLLVNDNNSNPELKLFRKDTSIGNGAQLGEITAYSNDTADNDIMPVASIGFFADGTFSDTNNPSQILFSNTPASSETIRQVARFDAIGNFEMANTGGTIVTVTAAGTGSNLRIGENAGNSIAAVGGTAAGSLNVLVGNNAGTALTTGYRNTVLGAFAGDALDTGHNNVAIGLNALTAETSGFQNIAIGSAALNAQNGGQDNTAIGFNAGALIEEGNKNVAIGGLALDAEVDGNRTVAIGYQAFSGLTSASSVNVYNVGVGFDAGKNATSSIQSTYVGGLSGGLGVITGNNNACFGYLSGYDLTSGNANTLLGAFAGTNLTTGQDNVAIGTSALDVDIDGNKSTAVGRNALGGQTGTDGDMNNVAIGYNTGIGINTGNNNTLVGTLAGDAFTTGSRNTMLGTSAGGALVGANSDNTFMGCSAGENITSGDANTIVGRYNGNQGGLDIRESSNNIVLSDGDGNPRLHFNSAGELGINTVPIGTVTTTIQANSSNHAMLIKAVSAGFATVIVDNTASSGTRNLISFRVNNTVKGSITSDGSSTAFNTSSDYRLKENVDYTWDATTRLKQLKPARFDWIGNAEAGTQDGFLAHEVSSVVHNAVTGEKDAVMDDGTIDVQNIDQSKLVPLLVKTIQELEARITALEA